MIKPWIRESEDRLDVNNATNPEGAVLPTRLIEVSDGQHDTLRLYVPSQEENLAGKYLTLSYRWGHGNSTSRTTRDNYADRLRGLDYVSLPLSIQDAILVTRALGFRYLWVDASCIIQLDPGDASDQEDGVWIREATRMGGYYSNAFLTIAATCSHDSSEGFLRPREAHRFPVDEVLWECSSGIRSNECTPGCAVTLAEPRLRYYWQHSGGTGDINALFDTTGALFLQIWMDLISSYSGMDLSFEKDKLIAIQGIMDRLLPSHPNGYSAGLFRERVRWSRLCGSQDRRRALRYADLMSLFP